MTETYSAIQYSTAAPISYSCGINARQIDHDKNKLSLPQLE